MKTCRHGIDPAQCNDADCFAEFGGEHGGIPFDDERVVELRRIATAAERIAGAAEGIRDILRGRTSDGAKVTSPLTALADALIKRFAGGQDAAPQTQKTPPQAAPAAAAPSYAGKQVASDADLDGQYGNPEVKYDLKKWPGQSFKGQKYSACDPQFLDILSDFLDWSAGEAKKKVDAGSTDKRDAAQVKFNPLDAARARGWAIRIRARGYTPAQPPPAQTSYI